VNGSLAALAHLKGQGAHSSTWGVRCRKPMCRFWECTPPPSTR
jgi:hypothetical protein